MRRNYYKQTVTGGTYDNPTINTSTTYSVDGLSQGYTLFTNIAGEPLVEVDSNGELVSFEFTTASSTNTVALTEFFNTHVDLFDGTSDFEIHYVFTMNPRTESYVDGSGSNNTSPWVTPISCNQYINATTMEEGFALRTYKSYSSHSYPTYLFYRTATSTSANKLINENPGNLSYLFTFDATKSGSTINATTKVGSNAAVTASWTCQNIDSDLEVILGGEIKYLSGTRTICHNANVHIREFSCRKIVR